MMGVRRAEAIQPVDKLLCILVGVKRSHGMQLFVATSFLRRRQTPETES